MFFLLQKILVEDRYVQSGVLTTRTNHLWQRERENVVKGEYTFGEFKLIEGVEHVAP